MTFQEWWDGFRAIGFRKTEAMKVVASQTWYAAIDQAIHQRQLDYDRRSEVSERECGHNRHINPNYQGHGERQ